MKKFISICLTIFLIFASTAEVIASGIKYLPDVTKEMSKAEFWSNGNDVLMTRDEIDAQNPLTIAAKGTCMYDLKNQAEVVNTIDLNSALISSTKADVQYYLGWTYLESDKIATQSDFDNIIANTQNPDPDTNDAVLYAVAVKRTHLHTFPSHIAIWDDPKDPECNYQYLSAVRVNEPLIITSVSNDKEFYLAKSICCSGWIPASDVAICRDKSEWLSAWDIPENKTLVVYGDKVKTEMSVSGKETSEVLLTMGTVLELAENINPNDLIDNRSSYQNYVVYLPVRNDDGSYAKKLTLISESEKVHHGFLPMTENNIVSVAFEALGNTYGWGGWLKSDDCSGYMRSIYKCFGLELARNTSWQEAMPMAKADVRYMCREDKINFIGALPPGAILYFSGHEMMYLGCKNDKFYVISAVGSMMQPENPSVRQRIRSFVINTLDVKRANGNTWFDEISTVIIPYQTPQNNSFAQYSWYHDGVRFCLENKLMKGDENKFFHPGENISWAQLLQILWNMQDEKTEEVSGENWYDGAVEWAKAENLICEENTDFVPDSAITREQLVSVLYLYAGYKGIDISSVDNNGDMLYEDVFEISDYAVNAFKFATQNNLINGKSSTTINPKDHATRAEIAVIIKRFVGLLQQQQNF